MKHSEVWSNIRHCPPDSSNDIPSTKTKNVNIFSLFFSWRISGRNASSSASPTVISGHYFKVTWVTTCIGMTARSEWHDWQRSCFCILPVIHNISSLDHLHGFQSNTLIIIFSKNMLFQTNSKYNYDNIHVSFILSKLVILSISMVKPKNVWLAQIRKLLILWIRGSKISYLYLDAILNSLRVHADSKEKNFLTCVSVCVCARALVVCGHLVCVVRACALHVWSC